MKAFVYQGAYNMPLENVETPVPGEHEVLIAVRSVGICGSDVHGYRGTTGRRKPPIIMGHELSGTVEKVGASVSAWTPGDRVVANPLLTCGVCENCRSGRPNICSDRHCLGVDMNGAYAEYVCVHEKMVYQLPEGLSFDQGAMVEPLAVAMRAVNLTPFQLGEKVVIIGAGTIGLLTLLAARMRGAGEIILTDTNGYRLERAKKLGADFVVNAVETDPVQFVKDWTNGAGAPAVIEAVGVTQTANQSLFMTKNGGNTTWIGNSQPEIQINMQQIVTRELNLRGTYGFANEFPSALETIRLGKVDPIQLVEEKIPLDGTGKMIDDLANGSVGFIKVIVNI